MSFPGAHVAGDFKPELCQGMSRIPTLNKNLSALFLALLYKLEFEKHILK